MGKCRRCGSTRARRSAFVAAAECADARACERRRTARVLDEVSDEWRPRQAAAVAERDAIDARRHDPRAGDYDRRARCVSEIIDAEVALRTIEAVRRRLVK